MLDLAPFLLEGIIATCALAVVGGIVWMLAVLKLQ